MRGQLWRQVLRALARETPATVRKGDIIHVIPEKGPQRTMLVSHVEHHIITLADPEIHHRNGKPRNYEPGNLRWDAPESTETAPRMAMMVDGAIQVHRLNCDCGRHWGSR